MSLCYCKKCGRIVLFAFDDDKFVCDCCNNIAELIPQEYLKSSGFSIKDNLKEEFIEKYIKSSPEFDQYLFDHREEILSKKNAKYNQTMARVKEIQAGKGNSVSCPYCKSTNVSKISTLGRSVSIGIFGLASSKVGKQWHCNGCKSDF